MKPTQYRTDNFSVDPTSFVGKVKVKKGKTTFVNWGCYISSGVMLGQGVLIGPRVVITTTSHDIKTLKPYYNRIEIGDNVFIGAGAVILGGNIICDNAVIGAGSVLTENHVVGRDEVWVGNPCKFLKYKL